MLDGVLAPVTESGAVRPVLDGMLRAVKARSEPDKERPVLDGVLAPAKTLPAFAPTDSASAAAPPRLNRARCQHYSCGQ